MPKMKKSLEIGYWLLIVPSVVAIIWFAAAAEGIGLMFYSWNITAPIVANLVIALAFAIPRILKGQSANLRFVFLPFVFTAIIILYGFLNPNRGDTRRPHAADILLVFLGLQLIAVLFHAVVAKGFRWLSISVGIFSMWLSVSVGFVVGMMVTGDWL